jgi:hypothetical protein
VPATKLGSSLPDLGFGLGRPAAKTGPLHEASTAMAAGAGSAQDSERLVATSEGTIQGLPGEAQDCTASQDHESQDTRGDASASAREEVLPELRNRSGGHAAAAGWAAYLTGLCSGDWVGRLKKKAEAGAKSKITGGETGVDVGQADVDSKGSSQECAAPTLATDLPMSSSALQQLSPRRPPQA